MVNLGWFMIYISILYIHILPPFFSKPFLHEVHIHLLDLMNHFLGCTCLTGIELLGSIRLCTILRHKLILLWAVFVTEDMVVGEFMVESFYNERCCECKDYYWEYHKPHCWVDHNISMFWVEVKGKVECNSTSESTVPDDNLITEVKILLITCDQVTDLG